jgi:hypothetical protein
MGMGRRRVGAGCRHRPDPARVHAHLRLSPECRGPLRRHREDGDVFDTWEWDGEAWTQVEDEGPQAPWFTSNIVYDATRQVTVLESGSARSFAGKGTWAWDGSAWTQLTNTGPAARQVSSLAFDSVRERVVLFGGRDTTNLELQKDMWEWDGAVCKEVQDIGPSPRQGSGIVGDRRRYVAVRRSMEAGLLGDTWAWDGGHWRQRKDIARLLATPQGWPGMASEIAWCSSAEFQQIRGHRSLLRDT